MFPLWSGDLIVSFLKMTHQNIIDKQTEMISLQVREINDNIIMIEGDENSLLYLSEYIREHARQENCSADVPLKLNVTTQDSPLKLFLHKLPCNEIDGETN